LPYTLLQHRVSWNSAETVPLMVALVVGTGVVILLFATGLRGLRIATLVPAVLIVAIAIRSGSAPLNDQLSARAVSNALQPVSLNNLPIAGVLISRETEFGLQFYRNQPIPRYELGHAPSGEHLVVARAGFQKAFARDVPGRKIVFLRSFPEQNLEFYYVGAR